MPQPTVSAPPDASPAAAPQFYRWEVSGKPLAIEIRLDVIERLDQEVVRTFRAITSRGSEIGGLLLGRVREGPRPVVVIEEYETVPCDYQRGPLYMLAEEDRRRLEQALARWRQAPPGDLRVVGYFRSNTRKELQLDDEDVAILKEYFPGPQQVCLLVKPFASKANLAGFFLWEGGEPQRRSDLTFAFNRAELSKTLAAQGVATPAEPSVSGSPATASPAAGSDGKAPAPSGAVAAEPAAASRPTIEVRIALAEPGAPSKRTPATARPAAEAVPAARVPVSPAESERVQASPDGKAVTTPPPFSTEEQAAAEGKVQAADERAKPVPRPHRLLIPAEELPAVSPEPEKRESEEAEAPRMFGGEAEGAPEPAARSKRSRALLGVAGLVLLGAAGLAVWNFSRGGAPATQPETSSLNLRVERSGGQLLLSWNRSLPLLQTAQRAILSISDGDHQEDVEMDLGQLRTGSIVYSPITSDVSFRLEVTDLKNGKSVSESVRVLGGRPSPTGPPAQNTAASAEPQPSSEAVKSQRQPLKTMAPIPGRDHRESLAARLSPVEPIPAASPSLTDLPARALPVPAPPTSPATEATAGASSASNVAAQPQARVVEPAGSQSTPAQPAASQTATAAATAPAPAAQPAKPAPSPELPAAQAQAGGQQAESPLRVGGQVQEARLIRRREPVYPPLARQARIQGVVRLEAVIGPDGRVEKVQAISGPPLLRQAAVDAVKEWVYEPSRLNGRPVRVTTQVEINFTLGR